MTRAQLEKLSDLELRKLLGQTRRALNLTLREVGESIGIPACNVWHVENDKFFMSRKRREQVLTWLTGEATEAPLPRAERVISVVLSGLSVKERKKAVSRLVEKFTE